MSFDPKYKSDVYEAVHSTAAGMFRAGSINEAEMAEFAASCLAQPDSSETVQDAKE